MKKKIYSILAAATLCMGAVAQSVTVADIEALSSGETVTFNIHYSDVSSMTSTHFEVNLPTGFSVDKVEATSDWSALFSHEGGVVSGMSTSANAFSGEGDIASMTVTIPAGTEVGAYPVSITNVRINGTDLGSEPSFTINVVTAHTVVLDETSDTPPTAAEGVNVTVKRTINAGEWSTLCLPFAMTSEQVAAAFGSDVQIADFTGCETEEDDEENIIAISIGFSDVTAMEAHHPYIIKVPESLTEFSVSGVDITEAEEGELQVDRNELEYTYTVGKKTYTGYMYNSFVGTYVAQTTVPSMSLFLSGNQFWYSTGLTKMKAFRGYFDFYDVLTSVEKGDYSRSISMDFGHGGETTGVGASLVNKETMDNGVYDLQGRRVNSIPADAPTCSLSLFTHHSSLKKGVYVRNGKKIVIK